MMLLSFYFLSLIKTRPPSYSSGVIDIEDLNQLAREHSEELGLIRLARSVRVKWNPRMRSTAGRAFYKENIIELNPKLQDISEEELHRTFLHELAHLVAHHRTYPRRIAPHGVDWRLACKDLGIPYEKATHNLPLPSRTQARPWVYTCPNCRETITRARRMKRRHVACYTCCKKYNSGKYHKEFALIESHNDST